MTNEVVFSGSKLMLDNDYKDPSKVSLSALGIPNYKGPFGQQSPYAPVAFITSWGGLTSGDLWEAGGLPLFAHNSSYSVTDNLTKIKGAHALKFGGLIEQGNKQQNFNGDPEGRYIFATWGNHSTGNEFADILTGNPAQLIQSTKTPTGVFRFYNYEFYGQDSWKVRPNFTLEYGARIEFFPNNKELNNRAILFDPKAYDRSQGLLINNDVNRPNGILQAAKGQIPAGITRNPGVKIAPRLNFAWDINGKGSTVIRGGAGLFYNRVQGNYQYYSLQQPPNSYSATFDAYGFNLGYGSLGNINPFTQLGTVSLATANPDSIQIPRIATMSFSVARRLPFKNVLEVSYVGTLGRHLPDNRNINFIGPGRLLSGIVGNADLSVPAQRVAISGQANVLAQFRPFPAYSDIIVKEYNATSAYHSLQMTLSRQLGRRLTYFATYTFSKALGITGTNENGDNIDPIDARHRSYGVLPYDRTHIFNLSYNLNLPNGARGGFSNWLTRGLLNGWQMSGITNFQSGIPIRLRFSGDIQPNGATTLGFFGTNAFSNSQGSAGGIAPVFLSNPQLNGKNVGESILSLSAIAIPAFGTSGPTIPPFYLRSPHRSNFDMTFFKNFNFTESKKLQFRAGFFNIFNQAFPLYNGIDDPNNDFNARLVAVCNVTLNNVPNGAGGTSNNVCDPTQGYHFDQNTVNTFGKITGKHGHRVVEFALKFYF